MFGLGTTELIIILVILLMIFGVGKLPQVAKMLGSGVNSFRRGLSGDDEEDEKEASEKEVKALEEDKSTESAVPSEQKRQADHV